MPRRFAWIVLALLVWTGKTEEPAWQVVEPKDRGFRALMSGIPKAEKSFPEGKFGKARIFLVGA